MAILSFVLDLMASGVYLIKETNYLILFFYDFYGYSYIMALLSKFPSSCYKLSKILLF